MPKLSEKKQFSEQITKRFLQAMDTVVGSVSAEGKRITAFAFGKQVQVSSANLTRIRYATNHRYITLEAVARLCYYYGYSVEWIFTGEGPQRSLKPKPSPVELIQEALMMMLEENKKTPKRKSKING